MNNSAYFTRLDADSFQPNIHAEGAWSKEDYHFAALAGLLTHVIEKSRGDSPLQLARINFEILGRLPFGPATTEVRVIRPGRTIELVEATCTLAGRTAISSRAWYLHPSDTNDVAACDFPSLPEPMACPERDFASEWPGGFIAQMQARQVDKPRATWLTSPNTLVAGDEPIPVAEFLARVDAANGINPRQSPREWAFPNVDLTVHLFREPDPKWTGLETTVTWGATGVGLTSSVLHDIHGPVGRAEQALTLRRM
ncbi:thioesterase family protein [Corynebacterium epidermidicanis]|uniref:Thioesterase-like superfamily n=1 Tax=Corynebacterium epidermidicanis TaxID=1050174 RepID=A0A0G3GV10_9CORY|nr:thioesterase family protein [Corynebacterium epidermidicanis]AKK02662.1 Thioesterase-like superfamily [Corynebacterium epidermidicanis]